MINVVKTTAFTVKLVFLYVADCTDAGMHLCSTL